MNSSPMRVDLFFDADEYYRSGVCPWTFFAYPTSMADDRGLPPDDVACSILARIQERRIPVAIWANDMATDTTYLACRQEDMERLRQLLVELEDAGEVGKGYLEESSGRLFALSAKGGGTYQND